LEKGERLKKVNKLMHKTRITNNTFLELGYHPMVPFIGLSKKKL